MGKKKWTGPNERKRHNKHKGSNKRPQQKHHHTDRTKDREPFKGRKDSKPYERSK